MNEFFNLIDVVKPRDTVAYYDFNCEKIISKVLSINKETDEIKIIPEQTTSLQYKPTDNIDVITNKNYKISNEGRTHFYNFLVQKRSDFIELKNYLTNEKELFTILNKSYAKNYSLGPSNDEVLTTIKLYGDIDYWIASHHDQMSKYYIIQITETAHKVIQNIDTPRGFRPTITLLPKMETTGKDENGCWILVPQYDFGSITFQQI